MSKTRIGLLLVASAVLLLIFGAVPASGQGKPTVVSAFGKRGGDRFVHVWVVVPPGANANEVAKDAIRGQGARPIDSDEFATNGLQWDQFADSDPGNDFVLVNYNDKGVPGNLAGHRPVWSASQSTWTDVATAGFVFSDGGDTGRCPSLVLECRGRQKFDGKNDVGWLPINQPGVLGVTWFGTSTNEFDMVLDNEDFDWYIGSSGSIPPGSFDAESVWLHEFGHGLGLSHSDVEGSVLEPFYEGVRRALHSDDIAGITFLYPAATAASTGSISGTATNAADGSAIGGATVVVDTGQSDVTAGDGTYTIADVPTGTRTATASATGFETAQDSATVVENETATVDFALVEAPAGATVSASISYDSEGGRNGDKHLLIFITLTDDGGNPVSGQSVSIDLYRDGSKVGSGTDTTGSNGTTGFTVKNAVAGCYSTDITSVGDPRWDGVTPLNQFGLRATC